MGINSAPMKTSMLRLLVLGLCLLGLATVPVTAAPLAEGDAIPTIAAKDQHGAAYTFTNGTAYLLVAVEMGAAKAANKKLAAEGAGFLGKHNAAYLMDIEPMPGIARVFALPKMRKYPHRIVLLETKGALNWAPSKPGHITVLALTPAGRVHKITFWKSDTEPVAGIFQ